MKMSLFWDMYKDENGQKMSKSKGNASIPWKCWKPTALTPFVGIFTPIPPPGCPIAFHGKAVMEGQRKFMGTLWNTYAFYVLYANIDSFHPTKYTLDNKISASWTVGCFPSVTH